MANLRTLAAMRTSARRLADLENALNRFPDSEVSAYVNQGIQHVYAEMVTVQDRPWFSNEETIVVSQTPPLGGVSAYPLNFDFMQIMSVYLSNSGSNGPWMPLSPYEEADRPTLLNSGFYGGLGPMHYGITGGPTAVTHGTIPVAYSIEILPQPSLSSVIKIRYVPVCPQLVNDTDTFDGLLGFEEAVCTWAAILMRRKDDLETSDLERDMSRHIDRIRIIARRRDRSRPPRVSIVRGHSLRGSSGRRGWGTGF